MLRLSFRTLARRLRDSFLDLAFDLSGGLSSEDSELPRLLPRFVQLVLV